MHHRGEHRTSSGRSRTRSLARLVAATAFVALLLGDVSRSAGTAATTPITRARDLGYEHALDDAQPRNEGPSVPAAPLVVRDAVPSAIGKWAAPRTDATTVVGVHAVLLRTGKVLLWGPASVHGDDGYEVQTKATVFDPVTGKSVRNDPLEDADVFCGGATIL